MDLVLKCELKNEGSRVELLDQECDQCMISKGKQEMDAKVDFGMGRERYRSRRGW